MNKARKEEEEERKYIKRILKIAKSICLRFEVLSGPRSRPTTSQKIL
jgi:hypothetical protein